MKIFDCFMYYDEDFLLDLRLNIINHYVDKFVIIESEYNHQGKKKKKNFDIKNFKKFENKIIYKCIDQFPNDLNSSQRENFQRNYILNGLDDASENDLVLLSDLDEIPNLQNFKYSNFFKYYFFEQKFFYYKLNILNITKPIWYGSRLCKKKYLKSPQWFRNLKPRRDAEFKYSFWRIDKVRHKYIHNGGWHFSFLKNSIGIKDKIESYCHEEFNKEVFTNMSHIERCISEYKDIFNRQYYYKKINLDNTYPVYILDNLKNFSHLIEK